MVKHIIWDFNGTLLSDAQLAVQTNNAVFAQLGLPSITLEEYRAKMTMPVRDFYTAMGVDFGVHSYEKISRLWLDIFNAGIVEAGLIPGMLELVKTLHARGIAQSVLSASYEPSLLHQCEQLGLMPYMRAVNGLGDESATVKLEIGRNQMRALNLCPEQVVFVGDMHTDAELARALGAACILVPWGHNSLERLECTGAPIAESPEALGSMIMEG